MNGGGPSNSKYEMSGEDILRTLTERWLNRTSDRQRTYMMVRKIERQGGRVTSMGIVSLVDM
jgi:hypothetical protein